MERFANKRKEDCPFPWCFTNIGHTHNRTSADALPLAEAPKLAITKEVKTSLLKGVQNFWKLELDHSFQIFEKNSNVSQRSPQRTLLPGLLSTEVANGIYIIRSCLQLNVHWTWILKNLDISQHCDCWLTPDTVSTTHQNEQCTALQARLPWEPVPSPEDCSSAGHIGDERWPLNRQTLAVDMASVAWGDCSDWTWRLSLR